MSDRGSRPADELVFRPIQSRNAFEETFERLAHAIRIGHVAPGDRLPPERVLAERLGISRVTLREVLRALEHVGYVSSRRGRTGGTFVTARPDEAPAVAGPSRTRAELEDSLRFRRVLEPGAVLLAAQDPDVEAVSALTAEIEEGGSLPRPRYRAIDTRFHLALAELARCDPLAAAIADVHMVLNDVLARLPMLDEAIRHSHAQHLAILAAIRAGEPEAARAVMEEHVDATAALLRSMLP